MFLVTGGAGFIGSHIALRLIERGERVRVIDNLATGNSRNLELLRGNAELIDGDIRDADTVTRAAAGAEAIFHQAAEASVPRSMADPVGTYDTNVTGTLNVLLAARKAGSRRVVFASSSAVYGDSPEMPKDENMMPAPLSPYASSKLAGEHLCAVFTRAYGVEAVSLRYFNVFGPRQDPASAYAAVIPKFLSVLAARQQPVIFGDGGQSRDFIYIDNVVNANLKASEAPGVAGRVFNVASGTAITLNQMLVKLASLMGVTASPDYQLERAGDIRHSVADITAARQGLGFEIAVPFDEGLRRTVESMVEVAVAGTR